MYRPVELPDGRWAVRREMDDLDLATTFESEEVATSISEMMTNEVITYLIRGKMKSTDKDVEYIIGILTDYRLKAYKTNDYILLIDIIQPHTYTEHKVKWTMNPVEVAKLAIDLHYNIVSRK